MAKRLAKKQASRKRSKTVKSPVAPEPDAKLPTPAPTPKGRPSLFTQELADKICDAIAHGKSLRKVCEPDGFPDPRTVYRWLNDNDAFCQQYARSREQQAEYYADEIVETSDMAVDRDSAAAAKVRVDARKWVAAKLLPKKYGDRVEIELDDKRENGAERLEAILARAVEKTAGNA